jgi:hypothetical protein
MRRVGCHTVTKLYARTGIVLEWTEMVVPPWKWRPLPAEGALAEHSILELMAQMISTT